MWHKDYLWDTRWPNYFYVWLERIEYNDSDSMRPGRDRKQPYELSRFQHLIPLCNAFLLSKDRKYSEEAIGQISDWINMNPFMYGINWTCAMDVSIRTCNWIWAWWVFKSEPLWTEQFNHKFLKSLWQHGWYIENNLENRQGIRTNHYLSDIVGLLFISVMFPQFKDAKHWKEFSVNEMVRCMEEMVFPDGVSFENSTSYQRLVLELFTYSAILCRRNSIELPLPFWNRLEKMLEFVMYCTRPDGRSPMIGDNDDGRLFILFNYYDWDRWDHRYLLSIGSVLFSRDDFKIVSGKPWDEAVLILGEEAFTQILTL